MPFSLGISYCCGCWGKDGALIGLAGICAAVFGPGRARIIAEGNVPKAALLLSGRWGCADDGPGTEGGATLGVWLQDGPVPKDPEVPANPRCWRVLSRSARSLSFALLRIALNFFILRACIHAIPRLRVLGWMLKHCWEGLSAQS